MDQNNEQYSESKDTTPSNNNSDIQTDKRKRIGENENDPTGTVNNNKEENEEPSKDRTFNRLQEKYNALFRTYRRLYTVKSTSQEVPSKIMYQKLYERIKQPQVQTQSRISYNCGDHCITAFPTRLEVVPLLERSQSKWYGIVVSAVH